MHQIQASSDYGIMHKQRFRALNK